LGLRLGVKTKKSIQPEKNELFENTYKRIKNIDSITEQVRYSLFLN